MIVILLVSLFIFRQQFHSRGTNANDQTAAKNENLFGSPKNAWLIIVVLAADLLLARGGMMFFTSTARLDASPLLSDLSSKITRTNLAESTGLIGRA